MKNKKNNEQLTLLNDVKQPSPNRNKRKSMIHVRGAFSESIGNCGCTMQMQCEDFDERTRVVISNKIRIMLEIFFEKAGGFNQYIQYKNSYARNTGAHDFCVYIISDILCEKIDLDAGYTYKWRAIFDVLHEILVKAPYKEVLDIIWVICKWLDDNYTNHNNVMYQVMNEIFEKEYVGYRFINKEILSITDKNEINEIESACNNPFDGCRSHIQKAVDFLADREHKDYKNCIKESICAVESICKIIVGNESADLSKALKKLKDNGLKLHSALEQAFIKLYAYTSDKGGIRHSDGLFESNVTFEEAKYMLVSCSAFVNYLIAEYGKNGGANG